MEKTENKEPKDRVLVDDQEPTEITVHDFVKNRTYSGVYCGPCEKGYIFENENGKVIIPAHSSVNLAMADEDIETGTMMTFHLKGFNKQTGEPLYKITID